MNIHVCQEQVLQLKQAGDVNLQPAVLLCQKQVLQWCNPNTDNTTCVYYAVVSVPQAQVLQLKH